MTTNNMYRVGDFVYFETSVTEPYQIRKIEELNKTSQGAVEAKAICYYRRRDLSKNLLLMAEKQRILEDSEFFDDDDTTDPVLQNPKSDNAAVEQEYFKDISILSPIQNHQAKHRELFVTRQIETLPATHIRGKCNVTLYNDAESIFDYLNKEDTFFYKYTYESHNKSLFIDRNAIRVGSQYQTQIRPYRDKTETFVDRSELVDRDTLVFLPNSDEEEIKFNSFCIIVHSVGMMGRSLDPQSIVNCPNLMLNSASTNRDFTLQRAHDLWFQANKNLSKAISLLLPSNSLCIYKDQLEKWSASEHALFFEGFHKLAKDFFHIRKEMMPWKSLTSVIEYYYMWKSTNKYWEYKKNKSSGVEQKLKQVYIPNFLKPNPAVMCQRPLDSNCTGCESCLCTKTAQWYNWGSNGGRLCANCWSYWKRFGGLRNPTTRDITLENSDQPTGLSNGDNTENLNQVGSFKCTQPNCDKEFRVKAQLARHLHNNHNITQMNGSWDILNQYSKTSLQNHHHQHQQAPSNSINHLYSQTGGGGVSTGTGASIRTAGGGLVKPRSTAVFKVNLRFRIGRVLFSKSIKPKKIARNHACINSSEVENIFQKIEKIPLQNLTSNCLKKIFRSSKSFKEIPSVIGNLWKRKGLSEPVKRPDFLNKDISKSNGVHNKDVLPNNKRNGIVDESNEPLRKVRKVSSTTTTTNVTSPTVDGCRKVENCVGKDLSEKTNDNMHSDEKSC